MGRITSVSNRLAAMSEPAKTDAATKNAPTAAIVAMTKVTANSTTALAASAGNRVGTAASVERIIPVEYSPEMTSTPSTATTSWPKYAPNVEACTSSSAWASLDRPAASAAPAGPPPLTKLSDIRSAMPSASTTRITYDQTVERSLRSLI